MEIWLIQDGKKTGPFNDYEIRDRISSGQIKPDQFGWHEGLSSWVKLREIELFRDDLERVEKEGVSPAEASSANDKPGPPPVVVDLTGKRHLARRFWARWLDLVVYSAVWWLLMYVAGGDIGALLQNTWVMLSMLIPWFVMEAWLLHRFGTTPGKWLLGIRVVNDDGTNLTLKSSSRRSVRVLILGLGLGWGLLLPLCQAMSWFTTRRIGKPVWDFMGQHKITVSSLKAYKIALLVLLFITASQLQTAVRWPHDRESFMKQNRELMEKYPELRKILEDGDQWYFPVRK